MYTASNEVTRYTRHLILLLLYAEAGSTGYSQCVRTSYKYVYIQHHMQRLYGTWSSLPILALVAQTRAEVFVSNGHRGHCSHCFHMDNAITSAITWTLVSPLSHGHYSHVDTTITWTSRSRGHYGGGSGGGEQPSSRGHEVRWGGPLPSRELAFETSDLVHHCTLHSRHVSSSDTAPCNQDRSPHPSLCSLHSRHVISSITAACNQDKSPHPAMHLAVKTGHLIHHGTL